MQNCMQVQRKQGWKCTLLSKKTPTKLYHIFTNNYQCNVITQHTMPLLCTHYSVVYNVQVHALQNLIIQEDAIIKPQ